MSSCSRCYARVDVRQVLDGNGKVGGLLDITKCLYDAIDRLEKAAAKQDEDGQGDGDDDGDEDETSSTLVLGAVMAAKALKGKPSGKNNRALQVSPGGPLFAVGSSLPTDLLYRCRWC